MPIRPLTDVPTGSRIFVDSNILIYHLLDDELYGETCRGFLRRVDLGAVTAFTSPIVVSETLFIYLRAWIIQNKKIAPKQVLHYLKRHRAVIQEVDFHKSLALLALLRLLSLTSDIMTLSSELMARYQLLPADSTQAALIQHRRLPALATRDDDFDNIEGLAIYKP